MAGRMRCCQRLNRTSIAAALDGVVTPANAFCCDGGGAIVAFARRAGIAAHVLQGQASQTPTRQITTSTTSMLIMDD